MNYELWHCDLKIVLERPSKFWKKYSTYVITKFFSSKNGHMNSIGDFGETRKISNNPLDCFARTPSGLREFVKTNACWSNVVGCPWTCVYIYVYIQTELFSVSHHRDCYRKGLFVDSSVVIDKQADFFKFYIWLVRITWEPSKSVIIIIII